MKKRLLAFALAATMMFSSVNVAFAEDTAVTDDVVIAEETAVPDDVESDSAVEDEAIGDNSADGEDVVEGELIDEDVPSLASEYNGVTYEPKYPKSAVEPWKASVSGNVGGFSAIGDTIKDGAVTEAMVMADTSDGNQVPFYEIRGTEDEVYMRVGAPGTDGKVVPKGTGKGKIAKDTEGLALYYQTISPDTDFELSATANVIANDNVSGGNGQSGFGLVVGDSIVEDIDYRVLPADNPLSGEMSGDDKIAVGRLKTRDTDVTKGDMLMGWGRDWDPFIAGTSDVSWITKGFESKATANVSAGSSIKLKLKKSGDVYTLTSDDGSTSEPEKIVIDNREGPYDLTKIDPNSIYVGLCAGRCVEINWTDINFQTFAAVSNIEVINPPSKLDYLVNQAFDPTGMELRVNYVDGSTRIITADDVDNYSLLGFDDTDNNSFSNKGERQVTVAVGAGTVTFNVNVVSLRVEKLVVDDAPVKLYYYAGTNFDPFGFSATATLNDGNKKELTIDDVELTVDGNPINKDTLFTAADAGTKTVTVSYRKDDENIDAGDAIDTFELNVSAAKIKGLKITSEPTKTTFFTGHELNAGGLVVMAMFDDGTSRLLTTDDYEITGFNSEKPNPALTLTVVYKADPSVTTTFDVIIAAIEPNALNKVGYPRTTYSIGEQFIADGMVMNIIYTDSSTKQLRGENAYYKDAKGYYTINENGIRTDVDEKEALSKDFYMDVTGFDSSTETPEGQPQTVILVINKELYPKLKDQEFKVVITKPVKYLWKAAMMGPSATDMKDGISSIVVTDAAGKDHTSVTANPFGALPDVMINGEIPNVKNVHINTWKKAGKIATDQDGIAYYYTEVDGSKNFEISANIKVDRYMAGVADLEGSALDKYNNAIKDGCTPLEAMDRARDGQEAFGIMARDTVQLAGGVVDGEYRGNAAKSAVRSEDAAKLYYVFDGNNICQGTYVTAAAATKAVNELGNGAYVYVSDATMYEAQGIEFGDVLKASNGITYEPVPSDISAVAVSNIIIAGGTTTGTFPSDPSANSYEKNANMNRINILVRAGVTDLGGTGSTGKVFAVSSTDKIPEAGDIYNVTLKKFNTGYQISTKMLLDEENNIWSDPRTEFVYDTELKTNDALITQNTEKYYVGFFTCRWAEIEVSDIHLYETDPSADSGLTNTVIEKVSPRITVNSAAYSASDKGYDLLYKTNGTEKLSCSTVVSLNDKRIQEGVISQNKEQEVATDLVPNSVNKFTIVMYPNTSDTKFTNYNTVIAKHYVNHSNRIQRSDEIYVAPDGDAGAAGTIDDPVDLETAIYFVKIGGTIIMLDGTYNLRNDVEGKLSIPETRSSYAGNPTTIKAAEGAHPVIDLEKKYVGFEVDADYWVFSGLTIINSKDNEKAFGLGGDHCVVEYCTFYNNGTTAFQISRIKSDDSNIKLWPSYNVVRHCESFNNYDPSQNNADGFAAKLTVGYGNVFEDCISHHNADDGWDCYTKIGEGAIGASVLENCVSYRQQHRLNLVDGTDTMTNGSGGNGFKLGGEDIYVKHYLKDCITFENAGNGVDSNNNPAIKIRNVIAYKNGKNNFGLYGNPVNGIDENGKPNNNNYDSEGRQYKYDYDLEGAVSAGNVSERIYTWNVKGYEMYANLTPIEKPSNYLQKDSESPSQNSEGVVLDEATFFKSTNKNDVLDNFQRYSRKADGSFEHGDFLARTVPYNHKPEDLVILPDLNGGNGNVGVTETTTAAPSSSTGSGGSGGGGGGGGGGGKVTVKPAADKSTDNNTDDSTTAKASPFIKEAVKVTIGSKEVEIGGQKYTIDAAPYIQSESSSTLVPLRFVSIALLGGDMTAADDSDLVTWNGDTKSASIKVGDKTVVFTAGSNDIIIDGTATPMEYGVKAEIVDGRMYVPFRALGNALGVDVEWDAETKTASFIPPVVAEEPTNTTPAAITKENVLKAAEALDSILSISADRAADMAGPAKTKYAEMTDKLATILKEAAYDMTDEEIAASVDLLTGELFEYFTEELPKTVSTVDETNAKITELKDALLTKTEEAPAETAEAEIVEATTVAE